MTTEKKICALPGCEVEFTPKAPHQKCCSTAHKNKLLNINRAKSNLTGLNEGSPAPVASPVKEKEEKPRPRFEFPRVMNTDIQTQVAISLMDKEIDRVTAELKDERDKRRKSQEENQKLRDELASLKTDTRIAEIEKKAEQNAKPSGLGALMESSVIQELMPHIAPAIGKFLEGLMTPGAPQVQGLPEGEQGEHAQQFVNELMQWAGTQPVEVQNKFVEMVGALSKMTPQQTFEKLTLIVNLLRGSGAGSPMTKASGGYGS